MHRIEKAQVQISQPSNKVLVEVEGDCLFHNPGAVGKIRPKDDRIFGRLFGYTCGQIHCNSDSYFFAQIE